MEDNDSVRQLAHELLLSLGYSVLVAPSGAEAISIAERHNGRIGLLLTDVVMPGMNGPELAHRLAILRPEIRTLYMSGYISNAILQDGDLDEGAFFLSKPFTRHGLADKVLQVFEST